MAGRLLILMCLALSGCVNKPHLVELVEQRLAERLGRDGWTLSDWDRDNQRPGEFVFQVQVPDTEAAAAFNNPHQAASVLAKAKRLCPTESALSGFFDGRPEQWAGLSGFSVDIVTADGSRLDSYRCLLP